MVKRTKAFLISCFLFGITTSTLAQSDTLQKDINLSFNLIGDTLVSNQGIKLYEGKRLVIGKGSGENGWYKSVSFKSPSAWPLVIGRDADLKYNEEYQRDESIRDKDIVKESLHAGDTLIVTKIKKRGSKRHGYFYVIHLRQCQGVFSLNYSSFIADAIKSGEVLVLNE